MSDTRSKLVQNLLTAAIVAVLAIVFWDKAKVLLIFLATLGVLVAVHEWGHFIAARACGVHVYEFAIGFGPKLITYMRRHGTEYTIRALPLGGFVNLKGMQPDDPITHDGLNGRRPAERALVYLAGPLMNIILGFLVFCLMGFVVGRPDEKNWIAGTVVKKSPAAEMGLKVGDRLLSLNDRQVDQRDDIFFAVAPAAEKPVSINVRRGNQELTLTGTPRKEEEKGTYVTVVEAPAGMPEIRPGDQVAGLNEDYFPAVTAAGLKHFNDLVAQQGEKPITLTVVRGREWIEATGPADGLKVALKDGTRTVGKLGLGPQPSQGPRVSFLTSVQDGATIFVNYFQGFYMMFQRGEVAQNVGGPLSILDILGQATNLPPMYYTSILASLSLSLAVFNLIPIPVLDGGHMFLLTWEVLRRRRLEPEMQKIATMCGLAIVGVIFVLILFKDIRGIFG
jgi:regulator of sigma E protease